MTNPIISVKNLNKVVTDSSGSLHILHDISFEVGKGQTLAIVGASGSGKSTLLSIIAGLDTPSSGSVHILGQDLFAANEDARAQIRAQSVGFVFQSFQLLGRLTALENVMLALELQGHSSPKGPAIEMLKRVGLSERLHHYPKTLSGGEQQRVALARAFVVQPALLLADEPTGSLDFATGRQIMDLMMQLNQDLGTTLIMVTHDNALAKRCARVMTIAEGRASELTSLTSLEAETAVIEA